MNFDLRGALNIATSEKLERHIANIENMKRESPHSIDVIQEFDIESGKLFNCFMFALDIHNEQWARAVLSKEGIPSSTIIRAALTEHNINYTSGGEIIVYLNSNSEIKHMGRMQEDGFVTSKWGIGHLWRHAIFEVPTAYGDTVRYLSRDQAEKIVDYCRDIHLWSEKQFS